MNAESVKTGRYRSGGDNDKFIALGTPVRNILRKLFHPGCLQTLATRGDELAADFNDHTPGSTQDFLS